MRRAMYNELDKIELKPEVWCRMLNVRILDADGWRNPHEKDFGVPVTLSEFVARAYLSTAHLDSGGPDLLDCEKFAEEDGRML